MTELKAALQEACLMELDEIPSEEHLSGDAGLTFSPAFECEMKKLIRRADHPVRYRVVRTVARLLLGGTVERLFCAGLCPQSAVRIRRLGKRTV